MYFFGFSRYSNSVSSFHVIPLPMLASVYENPGDCPVFLPKSPFRLGPTLCL
ncbi:unnamed protein product, partial [Callosobruchus maculatus]